jgi:hypothetical protein
MADNKKTPVPAPAKAEKEPVSMGSLFTEATELDSAFVKAEQVPSRMLPQEIPVGKRVVGEIIGVVTVSKVYGPEFQIRHEKGLEFSIPANGSIRRALVKGNLKTEDTKLVDELKKYVGYTLALTRLPNKSTERDLPVFDVRTKAPATK